jgi:hypothetical protein
MKNAKILILIALGLFFNKVQLGQCADPLNIYTFSYNGHVYEVVKENKTWTEAVVCAVSKNGYLAEINDLEEQNAIFDELTNNANINLVSTQNQFGTASIWLGGSDAVTEGNWIWDGGNDGIGNQFWSGGSNGVAIGGLYTNWGTSPAEPDNSGGQDHLTLILKPTAVNFGLWNDLVSTNSIYYLIEYESPLTISSLSLSEGVRVYPNPFSNKLIIENNNALEIDHASIYNVTGQKVRFISLEDISKGQINVSDLDQGIYFVQVQFKNGESVGQKIIK